MLPPAVPGLMDANSRTMFPSPISRVLGSPRYLRSCGGAPTLANWKMRQPAPIVVRPVTTACGPIHESRPTRTCGPTTAYASTTTPVSSSAPGATTAVGWMRGPAGGAAANSTSATSAGPAVATPRSRQGGPAAVQVTSSRSVSPGSTGRRKRALSTATRRRSSSAASRPPSCTRASHSMTPGRTGAPGKCPAKYGSLALTRFTPTARFPGSTSSTRSTRTYGNARRPLAPRSGWFVMGALLLARAALRPLLVGRGVVELHDLVGHVDRLVIVEERAAGGLEHERVAVLLAVVAHQLVELLDDALGELGVGLLEIALEVLVLALELEAAGLEVLLEVAPLLVLEHRRLALVVLLQPVQVLALLLQLVLRALELGLHLILGPLAGVALVERALHVDHGDLLLRGLEPRRRPEHDRHRHEPERRAGPPAGPASHVSISHVSPLLSSVLERRPEREQHEALLIVGLGVERLPELDAQRADGREPAHPGPRREAGLVPRDALVRAVSVAGVDEQHTLES